MGLLDSLIGAAGQALGAQSGQPGGLDIGSLVGGLVNHFGGQGGAGLAGLLQQLQAAGLGDHTIVTSLCPGGKERMRRLINVVEAGRFAPRKLITHSFSLDQIEEAYDLFANQRDGVLKVAIRP